MMTSLVFRKYYTVVVWFEIVTTQSKSLYTTHTVFFADKHLHVVLVCLGASLVRALHVAAPAQINNGAKESFSCRSTLSTPNAEDDDSAVWCPLCVGDTAVERARPTGATCVKAKHSVPRTL